MRPLTSARDCTYVAAVDVVAAAVMVAESMPVTVTEVIAVEPEGGTGCERQPAQLSWHAPAATDGRRPTLCQLSGAAHRHCPAGERRAGRRRRLR